jgi:putative permease
MIHIVQSWFHRYFSDPEAVLLLVVLLFGFGLVIFLGGILAPVFASIVIAYLLQWMVAGLEHYKVPRILSVCIVFLGFFGLLMASCFILLPLLWKQLIALFDTLPTMLTNAQHGLDWLSAQYPDYFSDAQIHSLTNGLMADTRSWGKVALSASFSSISSVIVWLVYLVLVPLLVFFFLKDSTLILQWVGSFLPSKRGVLTRVSTEVNAQIGRYIRGKVLEIIIVFLATYAVLWWFQVPFAALLSFLVGLSSLIPYIGGIVATIPVVLVAYLQLGWSSQFGYLMLFYTIVQGLDANLLVPLLFSEAVNLHPIAIVVATLVFGGIWGFWGVFFAIPLATLIKAVIYAWPKSTALK